MNSLVKELIQPLLEATQTIALYPGKFKLPHAGHFNVAKQLLTKADEVQVIISPVPVDGITAEQSKQIWELYNTLLGGKLNIIIADKSPVKYVLDAIKENPDQKFVAAFGKGESSRYKSLTNNPNVEIFDAGTFEDLNARDLRAAIQAGQDISKYLPKDITPDQFFQAAKSNINELTDSETRYWALYADIFNELKKDTDHSRVYDYLKTKLKGEQLEALDYFYKEYFAQPNKIGFTKIGELEKRATPDEFSTFEEALGALTQYMVDKGLNIQPLPKVIFINDDVENAQNILGRTAYYDPNNNTITIYTLGRHPKDMLRSFSHEMIHRIQNNEGRLKDIDTTDTTQNGYLKKIEEEAYLNGNIIFRNWEDSVKNKNV